MAHYYHIAIRRWVFWTSIGGALFGASVLANLAFQNHAEPGDLPLALVGGAVFWGLFSVICWSTDSIEMKPLPPHRYAPPSPHHEEWEERAHNEALLTLAEEKYGEPHPVAVRIKH